MMLIELSPHARRDQEQALPPIWKDGEFSPERIRWYTRLCFEEPTCRGDKLVIPELIAAMIGESSLNNLTLPDNQVPNFGVGWMQFDTAWHVDSIAELHAMRDDPLWQLKHACDPVNGMCTQLGVRTMFKKELWHAWDEEAMDPIDGWSRLQAALDAWQYVLSNP